MQPRRLLTFFAARIHCSVEPEWFVLVLLPLRSQDQKAVQEFGHFWILPVLLTRDVGYCVDLKLYTD